MTETYIYIISAVALGIVGAIAYMFTAGGWNKQTIKDMVDAFERWCYDE